MTRYRLSFELRQGLDGPALHREPVTPRDLIDPLAELWWNAGPRRGAPRLSFCDLHVELRPVYIEGQGPFCSGFTLSTNGTRGICTLAFERTALDHVARRAGRALLADGVLRSGDAFVYFLRADPDTRGPRRSTDPYADLADTTPDIDYLVHPLAPLLEMARVRGPEPDPERHPVFFSADACTHVERISRRGAAEVPAVETGCVLVGSLVSCPDTGEMYTVVVDALEATDTTQTQFTLSYTAATWARIQAVLRARRAQPATSTQRILGQAHSHPFLPLNGAPPCAACQNVEVCSRTTAVLSSTDLEWCRAVFGGEPWQLSQVFGLDARARNVDTLYSQHRGVLEPRGFHVLPEFPLS